MKTIKLTDEELHNLKTFLERTPLTGIKEAGAILDIVRKLSTFEMGQDTPKKDNK